MNIFQILLGLNKFLLILNSNSINNEYSKVETKVFPKKELLKCNMKLGPRMYNHSNPETKHQN